MCYCPSTGLVGKLAKRAGARNMEDQTIGPILSWTTEAMLGHVDKLQRIPGASLAFGGTRLEGHTIPERYGAIMPTAVFVPLKEILKPENFALVTTEVFGPVQVASALPPSLEGFRGILATHYMSCPHSLKFSSLPSTPLPAEIQVLIHVVVCSQDSMQSRAFASLYEPQAVSNMK